MWEGKEDRSYSAGKESEEGGRFYMQKGREGKESKGWRRYEGIFSEGKEKK